MTLVVAGLVALAATWRPPIRPIERPAPTAFDSALVARGAGLAAEGDCQVCHTAPGGAPYAGGRPVPTPFGTVFASNITPDAATGIGGWSEAAFTRALREGLARNGAQLYPAFPYDHFRYVDDADVHALYAFLMTRRPVAARTPANRLIFPLNFRPLVAGWKLVALPARQAIPANARDPAWSRGAYLVQGLGHCGACHTPHNALGGEETDRALDGGSAEGWYAPPLNGHTPAATAWTTDRLFAYLRTGFDADHAAAAGPMGPVTRDLARAPEADVRAIAAYIATQMAHAPVVQGAPSPAIDRPAQAARDHPLGAQLFEGACAACHGAGAPMRLAGRPPLQLGSPLQETTPRNAILMIEQGLQPPVGRAGPYMPSFKGAFSDAQTAELVAYLRERFSNRPAWTGLPHAVAEARRAVRPAKEAP